MSQVTITAKTGPALQVTSLVLTEITNLNFDLANRTLSVLQGSKVQVYDLSTVTAVTFTISGQTFTVVVS